MTSLALNHFVRFSKSLNYAKEWAPQISSLFPALSCQQLQWTYAHRFASKIQHWSTSSRSLPLRTPRRVSWRTSVSYGTSLDMYLGWLPTTMFLAEPLYTMPLFCLRTGAGWVALYPSSELRKLLFFKLSPFFNPQCGCGSFMCQ